MENDTQKMPALDNVNTCTGKMEIPTPREREALAAMKATKERVREIKKRLVEFEALKNDSHTEKIASLEDELTRLKQTWDSWETQRAAAAKERMILLGHETEE
jgi:predicted nuclease with TOPRIM domain